MGQHYHHLTLPERDMITLMLADKKSIREIARALGRSPSAISREVKRNASPEYRLYLSHRAHGRSVQRRRAASQRPRLKSEHLRRSVRDKLALGWSPEQIAGRLRLDSPGCTISHEAIYQYLYHPKTEDRQTLIHCLRRAHRRRTPRGISRRERKTKIPNRIPIEDRPTEVESRQTFGHWEGDRLVSRKSRTALNSLVERQTRLVYLTRLSRKTAEATRQAVILRLGSLPPTARRTLTLDNGTENTLHQEITAAIDLDCYFAHPYASWERGTCENTNGLVRWYLPKGTDFSTISDEQIAQIEFLLNSRPRKCLGFKTPIEVATSCVALQD